MIDDYLIRRLPRRPEDDIATAAWQLIRAGQGRVRVSTVAHELGCSQRALHSALQREAGIGPKMLSRIARFTSARTLVHQRLIRQQDTPTLADVAAACAYYDESHLIRDWTAFTGTTPADWRSRDELAFHQATGPEDDTDLLIVGDLGRPPDIWPKNPTRDGDSGPTDDT